MPKILIITVIIFITVITQTSVGAVENPITRTAAVTATVPEEPDAASLISPANNSVLASTAPTFIFSPSLGSVWVDHYQLFIDGALNTNNIPQSTNVIMTHALSALNEGQHTWMIKTIGSNSVNRNSATWSFTVDTTAPLVLINQIAENKTSLSSYDLSTIPAGLSFSTSQSQPVFIGQTEAGGQVTINLTSGAVSLTTTVAAKSDKTFSLNPKQALAPASYTVSVSATDQAGNTTSLPIFTLVITVPAGLMVRLPSPLPAIILPPAPQVMPKLAKILTVYPLPSVCTLSPLILIILLLLLVIILIQQRQLIKQRRRLFGRPERPEQFPG